MTNEMKERKRSLFLTVSALVIVIAMAFAFVACGSGGAGSGSGSGDSAGAGESAGGTDGADSGAGDSGQTDQTDNSPVRVGSKEFTENLLLGEIYALALEDKGGMTVERKFALADAAMHPALTSGEIDLYPEYTGTALLSVLQLPMETDPQKVYDTVKREYKDRFDVVWLDYSKANDGQGLAVTQEVSGKYGIETISDLQKNAKSLRFISQGEFDEREDGLRGLEKIYGKFEWKSSTVASNALKYPMLINGEGDVIPAYTTEGNLVDPFFVLLEDDKHAWPPYNIAPVVRAETLAAHPQIEEILNSVDALIDSLSITRLNAEVDIEGREYEEVAKDYYDSIKEKL